MKEIRLTNDTARSYGYNRLTGEACAYSMRALYELSAQAMQQYLNYSGLNVNIDSLPRSPWNDRTKYSAMIDNGLIENLIIYAAILENGTVIKVENNYNHEAQLIAGTVEELQTFIKDECNHYDIDDHFNIIETKHNRYKYIRAYDAAGPHRNGNSIHAATGMSAPSK